MDDIRRSLGPGCRSRCWRRINGARVAVLLAVAAGSAAAATGHDDLYGYGHRAQVGTAGTTTVTDGFTFVLTGGLFQAVTTPMYGQVPARQVNVFPGGYTDTITVTVNY
jgi:hypothetical protein